MSDKVAVVTNANKGLGYAIVKGLCQKLEGIIYLTTRDAKSGQESVKSLKKLGLKPVFHQLDICDSNSVKEFAAFIKSKHGGFDVLVNNVDSLQWDEVYPSYEVAKWAVDINYKSLLTVEKYLYPLLRDSARVVNISSAAGHLSNIKNKKWIKILIDPDLTTEQINQFVDEYLESVKNGKFDKNEFADDGKHAEHRVSQIAVVALTKVQQRKYENISINAVHPGPIKSYIAHGEAELDADESAKVVLYLIFEASPKLKGTFMWFNKKLVDWYDSNATEFALTGL